MSVVNVNYDPSVPREVVGLYLDPCVGRASGVLAAATGRGLEAHVESLATAERTLPREVREWFLAVAADANDSLAGLRTVSTRLSAMLAEMVAELMPMSYAGELHAIGVHGAGLWHGAGPVGEPEGRLDPFDSAQLAEATGANIVDAFANRDLAGGGLGGPVDALARWLLLHDAKKTRVLVDVDHMTRVLYLPASVMASDADRVIATDAGPGTALFERLLKALNPDHTGNASDGRIAVQGHVVPELLDQLMAAPYFDTPPPRWDPDGAMSSWFVEQLLAANHVDNCTTADLLCTATHLIAEAIVRCLNQHIPPTPTISSVVVTGSGAVNGLLVNELQRRLGDVPLQTLGDIGFPADTLDALSTAVLTLLHVDQVPATHTFTTGIAVPRVLGRLTPGSPSVWQRLLRHMAANVPERMSLRNAI